jgi:hypothetical protein
VVAGDAPAVSKIAHELLFPENPKFQPSNSTMRSGQSNRGG